MTAPSALRRLLTKDAEELLPVILGINAGDLLNYVNVCTAVRLYVSANHSCLRLLAAGLGNAPNSLAADALFELLLRFSASALIGETEIKTRNRGLVDIVRRFCDLPETDPGTHDRSIPVDLLLQAWSRSKDLLPDYPFVSLLFAEYALRVRDNGIPLQEQEAERLASEVSLQNDCLVRALRTEPSLRIVSLLLFAIALLCKLGAVGRCQEALTEAMKVVRHLQAMHTRDSREVRAALLREYSDLCFFGINAMAIQQVFPNEAREISELVHNILIRDQSEEETQTSDYRVVALRLAAMRYFATREDVAAVQVVFASAFELTSVGQIRDRMRQTTGDPQRLEQLFRSLGFGSSKDKISQLHALANRIEHEPIGGVVKPPEVTLQCLYGDCKAVAALVGSVALTWGLPAMLCLAFRQDSGHGDNHVWIELWDTSTLSFVPVDRQVPVGEVWSSHPDELVVRYPLRRVICEEWGTVLSSLLEQREFYATMYS